MNEPGLMESFPIRFVQRSRILRFLVVGGLTTAFSYAVYALLLRLGVRYAVANFGALVAGILFGFKTQGALVFGNPDNRLVWRFAACWLVIFAANVAFIRQMMSFGMNAYVAGAVAIPVIAVLSYLVQRFVVFRPTAR